MFWLSVIPLGPMPYQGTLLPNLLCKPCVLDYATALEGKAGLVRSFVRGFGTSVVCWCYRLHLH